MIFPNPVGNKAAFVTYKKLNAEITISNAVGQQILKTVFSEKLIIDVSSWAAGIYFVKGGSANKKFVVNR